jgi:hypothetical protein
LFWFHASLQLQSTLSVWVQEQIHIADSALRVLYQHNEQHFQVVARVEDKHESLMAERASLMRALTEYNPSNTAEDVDTSDLKERFDAVEAELLEVKEHGQALTQDAIFLFRLQVLHPCCVWLVFFKYSGLQLGSARTNVPPIGLDATSNTPKAPNHPFQLYLIRISCWPVQVTRALCSHLAEVRQPEILSCTASPMH